MAPDCTAFRDRWIEAASGGPDGVVAGDAELAAHARACPACDAWAARAGAVVHALRGLPRVTAPPELLAAAAAALEPRSGQGEPRWAGALAGLERRTAPHVLDRLVAEELAAPQQARARRFAGDLERLPVPTALELRLFGPSRPALRGTRALRWLAAAAALFAGALVVGRLGSAPPARPFEVVYELPADPHPLAASLVDGWAVARIRPVGGADAEGGR